MGFDIGTGKGVGIVGVVVLNNCGVMWDHQTSVGAAQAHRPVRSHCRHSSYDLRPSYLYHCCY